MHKKRAQSDYSDSCSDQQQSNLQSQIPQPRKPKIDRLQAFKNHKKITINVSMTQYPVVTQVAESLGWRIQTSNDSGDWDVYWTDFTVEPDVLIKMHLFQKINYFPGIYGIARKNLLGWNLRNMGRVFPEEYAFVPMTWMLPQQYGEFREYYENKQKGKVRTYIVKPEAQCQGRGIFLTRRIQDMQNGKHYVVQRYMARPYLLQGLKFDMRIYVLLCGTDPLKLYLYNQGLARLATQPYQQPNSTNLDNLCMHLTNYAINKLNPKFIFNNSANNMGVGHKRALSCVFKQLAQRGMDVGLLKEKIKDVIIKTIISGLPLIAHQYKFSQPEDYGGNMCFHVLGMDVMLNSKGDPFVIQVNHTPSFTTDTPLDHKIKFNLIKDTLVLMNITSKQKTQLYNRCKQYNQQRLMTGKRHIYEGTDREAKIQEAQEMREKYESKNLGGYQKIYPVEDAEKSRKYEEMIGEAMRIYLEQHQNVKNRYQESQLKKLIRSQLKAAKTKNKDASPQINPSTQVLKISQKRPYKNHLISQKKIQTINHHTQVQEQNLSLSQPGPATIQKDNDINNSILQRLKAQSSKNQTKATHKISKQTQIRTIRNINSVHSPNPNPNPSSSSNINLEQLQSKRPKPQTLPENSRLKARTNFKTLHKRQNPSADLKKNNRVLDTRGEILSQDSGVLSFDQQMFKKEIEKLLVNKIVIKSSSRPEKVVQKVERQMRKNYEKRVSAAPVHQGNYVMPKIISLNTNFNRQRQKDFYNFLAMGQKIYSTMNSNNA